MPHVGAATTWAVAARAAAAAEGAGGPLPLECRSSRRGWKEATRAESVPRLKSGLARALLNLEQVGQDVVHGERAGGRGGGLDDGDDGVKGGGQASQDLACHIDVVDRVAGSDELVLQSLGAAGEGGDGLVGGQPERVELTAQLELAREGFGGEDILQGGPGLVGCGAPQDCGLVVGLDQEADVGEGELVCLGFLSCLRGLCAGDDVPALLGGEEELHVGCPDWVVVPVKPIHGHAVDCHAVRSLVDDG